MCVCVCVCACVCVFSQRVDQRGVLQGRGGGGGGGGGPAGGVGGWVGVWVHGDLNIWCTHNKGSIQLISCRARRLPREVRLIFSCRGVRIKAAMHLIRPPHVKSYTRTELTEASFK